MNLLGHAALAAIIALAIEVAASSAPPNLLLILSDDQGYGDLGIYGNQDANTPNLDAFAGESVMFRNFHAQPLCAPTRAELMTGRRFLETGVWGVHGGRDYMNLGVRTIAQRLGDAGYESAMIGKWHLGKNSAYLPYNRGFDESWSIIERLYQHTDPVFNHNGQREQRTGWTPDILTELASNYIKRDRQRPFFLYVAYPEVHEPWIAPASLVEKYQLKGQSKSLAAVHAMNEQLDATIGVLLQTLKDTGLDDETVVIYLGDNGPIGATSNGLAKLTSEEMASRNPEGLRGVKGQLYENGTRVPGLIRWTGQFKPREAPDAADVIDIVPTLLELAGTNVSNQTSLRGQSLVPLLRGDEAAKLTRPILYANHQTDWPGRNRLYDFLSNKDQIDRFQTQLAIRDGSHKLVQIGGERELFDLSLDPQEKSNLSKVRPTLFENLSTKLDQSMQAALESDKSYKPPVFPIGYQSEEVSVVYAYAPSAIFGKVRTQSHSVDYWSHKGDGIAIRIRVDTPGAYSVSLNAETGDSSGTIRLTIEDQRLALSIEPGLRQPTGNLLLRAGERELTLRVMDSSSQLAPLIHSLKTITFRRVTQ